MRIIELSNGVKMPIIGFGTIGQFGKQVEDNVSFALQNGYRLIDTANRYTNEKSVTVEVLVKVDWIEKKFLLRQN